MSFKCPDCGRVSHHPMDGKNQYCGACHKFYPPFKKLETLIPEDWELKEKYPCSCSVCLAGFTFKPSMAMHFRENTGIIICPRCSSSLVVHINGDNTGGHSEPFHESVGHK